MSVFGTASLLLSAMQVYLAASDMTEQEIHLRLSKKFSSIIVSVVALMFGLLVLKEAIFTQEVKSTKMQNDGASNYMDN